MSGFGVQEHDPHTRSLPYNLDPRSRVRGSAVTVLDVRWLGPQLHYQRVPLPARDRGDVVDLLRVEEDGVAARQGVPNGDAVTPRHKLAALQIARELNREREHRAVVAMVLHHEPIAHHVPVQLDAPDVERDVSGPLVARLRTHAVGDLLA
eukprot:5605407-Prymnesium_polylepis.1